MNILPVILLSMSMPSLALFDKDSWEVDARYGYGKRTNNLSSSSTTYKSSSLNFKLNNEIDDNTKIQGVFTLDNPIETGTYPRQKKDKVRQLSLTHTFENNTKVKIGKQAFSLDKTRGVQELGTTVRSNINLQPYYCEDSLDFICNGRSSLTIDVPLNENTEFNLLASKIKYNIPNKEHYIARVKHTTETVDYYVKLGRNDDLTKPAEHTQYSLGLAVELKDSGNPNDKWHAEYEHYDYKNHRVMEPLTDATCTNYSKSYGTSTHNEGDGQKSVRAGRIKAVDNLLINIELKYLDLSNNQITRKTYCDSNTSMRSTAIESWSTIYKTAVLMLEYPIVDGKILAYHSYHSRHDQGRNQVLNLDLNTKINYLFNSVILEYNLSKNILASLAHSKYRYNRLSIGTDWKLDSDSTSFGLKYKF